jgi:hypothetical protein
LSPFLTIPFWENIRLDVVCRISGSKQNPKEWTHEIRDIVSINRRRAGLKRLRKNHRDAGTGAAIGPAGDDASAGTARRPRPRWGAREIKHHRHHAAGKFIDDYVLDYYD